MKPIADPAELVALPHVPRALRALGFCTPTYNQVWGAAMALRFPAERVAGRWHVRQKDLPAVAEGMGLSREDGEGI